MPYQLERVWSSRVQVGCQNCGHPINWRYQLRDGEHRITVGSECAGTLCGLHEVANMKRRATRAASQWRANKPARLTDETREQYVERRLAEMANARAAFAVLLKLEKPWEVWFMRIQRVNERARRLFHLSPESCGAINGFRADPHKPFSYPRLREHELGVIERRYHANRFDFDRPSWEIAKL